MFEQRKIRKEWRRRERLTPGERFCEDVSRVYGCVAEAETTLRGMIGREDRPEAREWLEDHLVTIAKTREEFNSAKAYLTQKMMSAELSHPQRAKSSTVPVATDDSPEPLHRERRGSERQKTSEPPQSRENWTAD